MFDSHFFKEEIPKSFTQEEQIEYFKRYKNGDLEARNLLITHNIKLVMSIVMSKYKYSGYDLEDLVSIGMIGLIKAVDTFDSDRLLYFSTYGTKCINNEILMSLRNKTKDTTSLDETIRINNDGGKIALIDVIPDKKTNLEFSHIINELRSVVSKYIDEIDNPRDRMIIRLAYGFDCERLTQSKIAGMLKLSRPYISRVVTKRSKQIIYKLYKDGLIDLNSSELKILNEFKIELNSSKKRYKSIFEHFEDYSEEEILEVIDCLNDEEKELIRLKYGNDYKTHSDYSFSSDENSKFFGGVILKIQRRLKVNREIKDIVDLVDIKKVYKLVSPMDAVIMSLRFGFTNGKLYSIKSISEYLNISEKDVTMSLRNTLRKYNKEVNGILDIKKLVL